MDFSEEEINIITTAGLDHDSCDNSFYYSGNSADCNMHISKNSKGILFTLKLRSNEEDPEYKFENLKDLSELAIGSGMGFRYDFSFFILRFDIGFKTYEPYLENKKWLRNYNFRNAVYNVGINYPF